MASTATRLKRGIALGVWGWDYELGSVRGVQYLESLQSMLDCGAEVHVLTHTDTLLKREQPAGVHCCPVLNQDAVRTLGVTRRLPFLKEFLDYMSGRLCDVFGYVNSDILLDSAAMNVLRQVHGAWALSRYDIADCTYEQFKRKQFKIESYCHSGFDLIAFTPGWWAAHRNRFPDGFLIGEAVWDNYYATTIHRLDPSHTYSSKLLYHRPHPGGSWSPGSPEFKHNDRVRNENPLPEDRTCH